MLRTRKLRTGRAAIRMALLIAAGAALIWPNARAASSSEDRATYPAFPVTVNGTAIDSLHSSYPLLLYRDITYFPMTWEYTAALGLTAAWDAQNGLTLQTNGTCAPLTQTLSAQAVNGSGHADATPVPFPVKVNGLLIDNAQERYPVLLYNNIIYFPMTWRFAGEMFNWRTAWDEVRGYSIQSCDRPAGEASAQTDALNAANGGQLAVKDDWIYMNPQRSSGGTHHLIKVKSDGSERMELAEDNALSISVAGDWLYYIAAEPSQPNAIYKIRTDGTGRTLVSDTAGEQLWEQDGYLYFLRNADRQPDDAGNGDRSEGRMGISRMNMDGTGERLLLEDAAVLSFYLHGGQIYYRTVEEGHNKLYAMRLDGTGNQLLRDDVTSFIIVDGWIYYMQDQKQLRKMSLDGATDIALTEFEVPRASIKTSRGGWLYVTVAVSGSIAGSNPIVRVRIDGTGREMIAEARPQALYIAGDEMYFANWVMGDSVLEHFKLDQ